MNKAAILYGDFGDVVCLSALTNFIKAELKQSFSIITQKHYKSFFETYSSANSVITYDCHNMDNTIAEIAQQDIKTLIDLHNSSFNDPSWVDWLGLLDDVNVVVSENRLLGSENRKNFKSLPQRIIDNSQHQMHYYLERLGYNSELKYGMYNNLSINPTDQDQDKATYIKNNILQGHRAIGIIPFSLKSHKQLPDISWNKLILSIKKSGYRVMLFGSENEIQKTKIDGFDYITENISNVQDYIPYILSCDSMVGIDTGLKHLSGYLGKNITTIYGHASPSIRGILGDNENPVLSNFYCSPCNNPFSCAIKNNECMKYINLKKIMESLCFNYASYPGEM